MAATHRLDEPGVGGDPHHGLGNGRTAGGATGHVEMRRDAFWGYITRVCNCECHEYIWVRDFFDRMKVGQLVPERGSGSGNPSPLHWVLE